MQTSGPKFRRIRRLGGLADTVTASRVFLFAVLLLFFKPYNVTLWPAVDAVFKVCKIAASGILAADLLFHLRHVRFLAVNALMVLVCFAATVLGRGQFIDAQAWLSIFMLAVLFHLAAGQKTLPLLVKYTARIFSAWIVLNTVTVLTGGPLFAKTAFSYVSFFLGGDNYFCFILTVMIGFITFADRFAYGRLTKTALLLWAMVLFTELYRFTAGGLAALFVMMALLWLMRRFPEEKFLRAVNPGTALAVNLMAVVSVAYLRVQSWFAPLLTRMGKGTDFGYRAVIWPGAVRLFLRHPILGCGIQPARYFEQAFRGADHCHNFILQVLVTGGVVGAAVCGCYLFFCCRSLHRVAGEKTRAASTLTVTACALFVAGIFDFYLSLIYVYFLLDMMWYARAFIRQARADGRERENLRLRWAGLAGLAKERLMHAPGRRGG